MRAQIDDARQIVPANGPNKHDQTAVCAPIDRG